MTSINLCRFFCMVTYAEWSNMSPRHRQPIPVLCLGSCTWHSRSTNVPTGSEWSFTVQTLPKMYTWDILGHLVTCLASSPLQHHCLWQLLRSFGLLLVNVHRVATSETSYRAGNDLPEHLSLKNSTTPCSELDAHNQLPVFSTIRIFRALRSIV